MYVHAVLMLPLRGLGLRRRELHEDDTHGNIHTQAYMISMHSRACSHHLGSYDYHQPYSRRAALNHLIYPAEQDLVVTCL
jgi:hypothetical protein